MSQKRVAMLDLLRGCAMILVVAYHLFYDLAFIAERQLPHWLTPGDPIVETIHTGFLWVLFAVSGICSGYSRNVLRRGAALYVIGFAITIVTSLWLADFVIVFGVLSCFGACMVLTALCEKVLDRIPWIVLTAVAIMLWWVCKDFSDGILHLGIKDLNMALPDVEYLHPIGIKSSLFSSLDYFPIIPFIFMFWAGRGLYRPIARGNFPKWFYASHCRPIEWIGSHSLLIYAIHQPILLAVVYWLL